MKEFINTLTELNIISVTVRLSLCVISAGLIGAERQRKHQPAGLRTHILVCIGSAMTMMLGQYMFMRYGSDPSRIGAQVISGIGFLGVGTILFNGGQVRGITTAAGLWASACMGLAIGAGFYLGAILGVITILFTLIVVRQLSKRYFKRHTREKRIFMSLREMDNMTDVIKLLRVWGVEVSSVTINPDTVLEESAHSDGPNEHINITLDVTMDIRTDSKAVMINLLQEDYVIYADYNQWMSHLFEKSDKF